MNYELKGNWSLFIWFTREHWLQSFEPPIFLRFLVVGVPRPARGAGTLIPSAQRLVWAAKQALGKAALGALFA